MTDVQSPSVNVDQTVDDELTAQKNKTGTHTDDDEDIIEDDLNDPKTGGDTEDGEDPAPKPPPIDDPKNPTYPLSTMLCSMHYMVLNMVQGSKVKNIDMKDFEYPIHLKPALEDALMKVAPALMSNPYVIIGGIMVLHTQSMMKLSKEREAVPQ